MNVPYYIQKELDLVNPMYFAVFNPYVQGGMSNGRGRWQIRKWKGVYPKRLDLWNTDMSEVIFTICKEVMTEDGLIDGGYQEIDKRAIIAMRESHWWKIQWKKKIEELDWRNEKRRRQADDELEYQGKYMAKKIWRIQREPTVCLSGKEWR